MIESLISSHEILFSSSAVIFMVAATFFLVKESLPSTADELLKSGLSMAAIYLLSFSLVGVGVSQAARTLSLSIEASRILKTQCDREIASWCDVKIAEDGMQIDGKVKYSPRYSVTVKRKMLDSGIMETKTMDSLTHSEVRALWSNSAVRRGKALLDMRVREIQQRRAQKSLNASL